MLHHLYSCLTDHMLIFVMFYLIYFTNYAKVDGINCASGFQAHSDGVRSRQCIADVRHCLITLSRESTNEAYNPHSFDCWPWPELENKCPAIGGVCHVLHKSKDDLHKTCCCYGHMCNNESLKIISMSDDFGAGDHHKSGLDHFGLRVSDRDSNVIVASQDFPNSGIVSPLRSDPYEDPSDNRLHIDALRIFVICGILLSTVCTVILLVFCLSPRYKKVRMKCFLGCNHSSSTSQYFQNSLDGRVPGALSIVDCFHCPKSSSFKSSYAGDCVITYPVQNSEVSRHSVSNGSNLHHGGSYIESLRSEFAFCDISETESSAKEIANSQLVAKFCRKEKLIGRGRFAEVWLANVPFSLFTNHFKITQDLLNYKNNNNENGGIKFHQSTNGSIVGHNSITNSSWHHLLCCQSDSTLSTLPSTTPLKCLNNNTSSAFVGTHPDISVDYLYNDKTESTIQWKTEAKECSNVVEENVQYTETTSPLLLSTTTVSSIDLNSSSINNSPTNNEWPMHVAVKTFTVNEYDAWKTELGIFKAIHSINKRLPTIIPSSIASATVNTTTTSSTTTYSNTTINNTDNNDITTTTSAISNINSQSIQCIHQMLKHIGHPNIVLLLGAGSVQLCQSSVTEYRLVMEFASGGSLRQLLSQGVWLSFTQILKISDDIVQGLGFLHSDLVNRKQSNGHVMICGKYPVAHRDLKPENILIRYDGTVCLSDFGQSVCLAENSPSSPTSNNSCRTSLQDVLTTTYSVSSALESMPKAGTLRYQAPEILDGAISFTGWALLRTDIYSLGLILWELLTTVILPVNHEKALHGNCKTDDIDFQLVDSITSMSPSIGSDLFLMNGFQPGVDHLNDELNVNYHTPEHRKMKKRHHWLPYEKELGSLCNSSAALQQLVCVEKYRPTGHSSWLHSTSITHFYRTINECWDHDPEARLTADCILKRIRFLKAQMNNSSKKSE
ncbi:Anti-Muellerian hormone type-2 receptor [Schistosoma japonicum]|nr:Anti-Muellerian hormone type-2 receptor [Schistosoma japonicum]